MFELNLPFAYMSKSQFILPFACSGCPYNVLGRCAGPRNSRSYLMQDASLVSCIDVLRRAEFLHDTYRRVIDIPKSSHQTGIPLPSFIPGVAGGLNSICLDDDYVVAVSLGEIVGANGNLLVTNISEVKRRFGLPGRTRVALVGTAKDPPLERLWKISDSNNIWKQISEIGFDWVTSLTYSVWDEMPRLDQIRNQDRNFQTHDLLANLGVPCIPFLFPSEEEDYLAVGEWMSKRSDVKIVAVAAQYYKRPYQIARLMQDMLAIEAATSRQLHFLVVGAATSASIQTFMRRFSTSILTWKPFHRGRTGRYCDRNLSYSRSTLTKEELVPLNFRQYDLYCKKMSKRSAKAA